jgi:hypothetical protein
LLRSDGNISQCVDATAGSTYYIGARWRTSDNITEPSCYWHFKTYRCGTSTYILSRFAGMSTLTWTSPTSSPASAIAPDDAQSLEISCGIQGSQVLLDQLFVNKGSFSGY